MHLEGQAARNRKGHRAVQERGTYCSITENSKHGFRLRRTQVTRASPQELLPSQSSLSAGMIHFCFSDSILPAQGPQEKGGSFSSLFPMNLLGLTAADDLDESPLGPNSCTFPQAHQKIQGPGSADGEPQAYYTEPAVGSEPHPQPPAPTLRNTWVPLLGRSHRSWQAGPEVWLAASSLQSQSPCGNLHSISS